jgi:hypothetical protein
MTRFVLVCALFALSGAGQTQTPAPPLEPSQNALLDRAAEYARGYQERLPNFVCTRITRLSRDKSGTGDRWQLVDTVEEELTVVDQKEHYRLLKKNGKPVQSKGPARLHFNSNGEFADYVTKLFQEQTQAAFQWDQMDSSGAIPVSVFRFQVSQDHSTSNFSRRGTRIIVGYRGRLYLAGDRGVVERLHVDCDDAKTIGVSDVTMDTRFAGVAIAEQQYWLPVQAETRARNGGVTFKREMEYRDFHKYVADTAVKFQ